MRKILFVLKKSAFAIICVIFFICFICLYCKKETVKASEESTALYLWQIDSFEGGKGSREEFLKNIGKEFTEKENCYINTVSITAEAARLNLANGNVPDIISYGAGMCGIENYVKDFTVWCNGSYCFLTLDANSDFSDINSDNTVINRGKDNLATATALFCGLSDAKFENSTVAYVKLINGDYKYLLGTQRDIYRLKTRNVSFTVKPITVFNDLYQNVSITNHCKNSEYAQKYINFLLSKRSELNRIGMYGSSVKLYDDEMAVCENIDYEYNLKYPLSEATKLDIEKSISLGDINILKELLK